MGDVACMEDRPLRGQVLARREPGGVVAGRTRFPLRHRPEHRYNLSLVTSPAVTRAYVRPRAYVRVQGPDGADLLQRIVSNDVLASDSCEALLLTAKGRVIAPLLVWRRADDDFLLLTEPELGPVVLEHLRRMRIAARCEIEPEEHTSAIVFDVAEGIPSRDYGVRAVEVLDPPFAAEPPDEGLERLRILARTPRWGREIDGGILPAEAGLDERAVSFTKGCYPGQEPLARLHNRGHVNRTLRVLDVDGEPRQAEAVVYAGAVVGRVTSAVPGLALAYVRVEVPDEAELEVGGKPARLHSALR
jgi:tRNA-modifying protein YgfZ